MRISLKYMVMLLSLFLFLEGNSQDSIYKPRSFEISGYLKEMVWLRIDSHFNKAHPTSLVHHRANLKWKPSENFVFRFELRNRLYWGDDVRMIPQFAESIQEQNGMDLSLNLVEKRTVVLNSTIERLWMEYRKNKWNLRAGRQRVNWGVTNTWNPNDIFNTYNFLDFDYEERPGSDALKFQYLVSDLSNIEMAVAKTKEHTIAAIKYFTNYKKYDLQLIAGVYKNVFTAGLGWAGSINDVGFKGELQFYGDSQHALSRWNAVVEGDYIFENGWYISSAVLYNERGLHQSLTSEDQLVFKASPRMLMPARWNIFLNASKEITPRLNFHSGLVFAPKMNLVILLPSMKYNLKPNLDLDLVWQSFFAERKIFRALTHTIFVRLKWNFASSF